MSESRDRLLDVALEEHFGAGPNADLAERILAASRHRRAARPARSRGYLLQAAGLAAAAALIGWAVFARPIPELPATVRATGEYEVGGGGIEARTGWYVLERGAPPVVHAGSRVEQVTDRVLVKTGEIPDDRELADISRWLNQQNLEEDMKAATWVKAGSLAVCLLAGSVVVDGNVLNGQAMERKRVQELERELEHARRKLAEAEAEAKRQAERGQRPDTGPLDTAPEAESRRKAEYEEARREAERLLDQARRQADRGETPTVIPPLRVKPDGVNGMTQEEMAKLMDEFRRAEENARDKARTGSNPTADPPRSITNPEEPRTEDERIKEIRRQLEEAQRRAAEQKAEQDARAREESSAGSRSSGPQSSPALPAEPSADTREKPDVDAAAELRKLLNDKDVELANLRSQREPDLKRIREVEASMAALRAALDALERQDSSGLRPEERAKGWTTHKVENGDSWWKIAHVRFKDRALSSRDIQRANPGVELRAGETIKIPPKQ